MFNPLAINMNYVPYRNISQLIGNLKIWKCSSPFTMIAKLPIAEMKMSQDKKRKVNNLENFFLNENIAKNLTEIKEKNFWNTYTYLQ